MDMGFTNADMAVSTLGECKCQSPLKLKKISKSAEEDGFVPVDCRVKFDIETHKGHIASDLTFEKAGPREKLFFEPARTRAAIVTCGGLCPGLNSVIRSVFCELFHNYGVKELLGIKYGYQGLNPEIAEPPISLDADMVDRIHREGGTILGSSRGNQPIGLMVDFLVKRKIDILFTVGGDGTQRGATLIAAEIKRRGLPISIIGIPKTIDNDILFVNRTFGFTTAVDEAHKVLTCAHAEAKSYPNGIGLVKLMGRDSGFIAAAATIVSQDVNFTLVPEIPIVFDGENGFFEALRSRIERRKHAVIALAEGAGQELFKGEKKTDASGNVLHDDIGPFMKDKIAAYFKEKKITVNIKYIDPSYIIRSVAANAEDSFLCDQYARNSVHAGMAGKTDMIVGLFNGFIHLPISVATRRRRQLQPESFLWQSVVAVTGQPIMWG